MMRIQQLPLHAVQLVLYAVAALLLFLASGMAGTIVALPLVPPVLLAAVGTIWLARRIGHGQHTPPPSSSHAGPPAHGAKGAGIRKARKR